MVATPSSVSICKVVDGLFSSLFIGGGGGGVLSKLPGKSTSGFKADSITAVVRGEVAAFLVNDDGV